MIPPIGLRVKPLQLAAIATRAYKGAQIAESGNP
jgi:hypothetical protein